MCRFVAVGKQEVSCTLIAYICVFQLAIEKYEEMFPAFSDSRELKLLKVFSSSFELKGLF